MKIRYSTMDDLQLLAEMNFELIKDEGHSNSMNIAELNLRMENWLRDGYFAAVIETENQVVGYTLWRVEEEFLYIRHFFIIPERRMKHYGKKAVEILKKNQWKEKTLRLEVLITNQVAMSFWQSVGFSDYCITMECKRA